MSIHTFFNFLFTNTFVARLMMKCSRALCNFAEMNLLLECQEVISKKPVSYLTSAKADIFMKMLKQNSCFFFCKKAGMPCFYRIAAEEKRKGITWKEQSLVMNVVCVYL